MAKSEEVQRKIDNMRKLHFTEEEIADVLACDDKIDSDKGEGKTMFQLDPELEKGAKKARQAERKPNSTPKREKKTNNAKQELISALADAVGVEVNITNPEREFTFEKDGVKYKVTLACPRS